MPSSNKQPNKLYSLLSGKLKSVVASDSHALSTSAIMPEYRKPLVSSILIYGISFLIISFVFWAILFEVDEVSIANGIVVPKENIVKIQILQANTIKETFIKEGELVEENQKLIEFDKTLVENELELNIAKQQNQKKRLALLNEQKNIRKGLYEQGLNSRISYLTTKGQHRELKGSILETELKIASLQDRLKKLIVTSPIKGYIHSIQKQNKNEVIEPGSTIFEIIPYQQDMVAEIKILPDEIGQIEEGQKVTLKFNTYDFSKFGGILSNLNKISPMTIPEPEGRSYYKGSVLIPGGDTKSTEGKSIKIIPGMTLIAEIKTGSKSIMDYLLGPITESAENAFKEK